MKRALPRISIATAGPRDVGDLMSLAARLAEYEKLPPPKPAAVRRTREAIREGLLHALIARAAGRPVGYALWFLTWSSFLARPTLYLEDLFVLPDWRGAGAGRRLFQACEKEARRIGCGRMEWAVLDWNRPAHRFYRASGARVLKEWMVYRKTLRKDAF